MHLYELPWFKALLVYVVLVAGFLLYGQSSFYRDPGSMFFDEARAFERQYSDYREREVREYIDNLTSATSAQPVRAGANPSICASFLSVKREGEQYLPLAVASCTQGLSSCERNDIHIDVLLAHTDMNEHPSSQTPWLSELVDNIHGYDVLPGQVTELKKLEEQRDFATKAVFDYTYSLENCYKTQSSWVVILEDDIVFADGWFIKTLQAVADIQELFAASSRDWLFLRLFNQERSIGWASSTPGQNHEFIISLLIIMPTFAALTILRSRSSCLRRHVDSASLAIICFAAIPTFVILFFQAGKASMLPPRPGVHKEAFGCCSQALVFPRAQVPRIREYLLQRERGQIDLMLDELAIRDSLDRYALYPVQVQHIGQRSVRGTTAQEAQAIWSMAFEQQNPRQLRATHDRLVSLTYGDTCASV